MARPIGRTYTAADLADANMELQRLIGDTAEREARPNSHRAAVVAQLTRVATIARSVKAGEDGRGAE